MNTMRRDAAAAFTPDAFPRLDRPSTRPTPTDRTRDLRELRASAATAPFDIVAATDVLTGLPLRASLERVATQLLADRSTLNTTVSLLVVDVGADAMTRLDQDGVGSQALLRGVARQLRNATRGTDVVARVADRQFMALLPGSSLHDARSVQTRVHHALSRVLGRRPADFAAIRLAVVAAPDHGTTLPDLFAAADRAVAEAWAVQPPTRLRIS
jgi:diguanylate cyclase (GGDEF)-like protein